MQKIMTVLTLWTLLVVSVHCETVREQDAVRAMVGEASNQGYKGLLAVGAVIRRRGSIQGLYGATAAHCDREPEWVWKLARRAWRESATNDITGGASHFESADFPEPKWARGMTKTVRIGKHQFYKKTK